MTKQWTSKDLTETSHISIFNVESRWVVEIEYVSELDRLLDEFKIAKGKREKGIVREKYKEAAKKLNSQYKYPRHNPEL